MTPTDSTAPTLDPSGSTAATAATVPVVDLLAEPTVEEYISEWIRYDKDMKAGRLNEVDIPGGTASPISPAGSLTTTRIA